MLMADQSMNNAFTSTYASGALAYHARLSEKQQLGLGLQASFGNRRLDYSKLTFGEQFTSGGFDMALPTGEMALSKMKSFISLGAGILYRYQYDYVNLDFGAAAFQRTSTSVHTEHFKIVCWDFISTMAPTRGRNGRTLAS